MKGYRSTKYVVFQKLLSPLLDSTAQCKKMKKKVLIATVYVVICEIFLHNVLQNFRQINCFTKELYCKSIWRKNFAVGENFRNYHIVRIEKEIFRQIDPLKYLYMIYLWKNCFNEIFAEHLVTVKFRNFHYSGGCKFHRRWIEFGHKYYVTSSSLRLMKMKVLTWD